MATLIEILKQNEQENKEKKDIASKLASLLETEEITKVLAKTIETLYRHSNTTTRIFCPFCSKRR